MAFKTSERLMARIKLRLPIGCLGIWSMFIQ
jgi:hypothetical protein